MAGIKKQALGEPYGLRRKEERTKARVSRTAPLPRSVLLRALEPI